jgi:hypothetical protein
MIGHIYHTPVYGCSTDQKQTEGRMEGGTNKEPAEFEYRRFCHASVCMTRPRVRQERSKLELGLLGPSVKGYVIKVSYLSHQTKEARTKNRWRDGLEGWMD